MKWIEMDNRLINISSISRIEFFNRANSSRRQPMLVIIRTDGGNMLTKTFSSDEELELTRAMLIGALGGRDEVYSL